MSRWFRLYDEMLDDPKVQMLSPELFKAWVNLLALASRNDGVLPAIDRIAFALRASPSDTQSRLDDLILAGLIDIRPDGKMEPHNWSSRQWKSDDSKERVRKHREAKKRECNGDVTVTVTPPEAEAETDTELASTPLPPSPKVKEQGFKFELKGQGKGNGSEVRKLTMERAEGFGLDVNAILAEAQKGKPSSLDAYFRSICRRKLKEKIPHVGDEVLKAAFERDGNAFALVCAAILEAA